MYPALDFYNLISGISVLDFSFTLLLEIASCFEPQDLVLALEFEHP